MISKLAMLIKTRLKISAFAGQLTFIRGKHTNICIMLINDHNSDKADDKIVLIAALPIVIAVEIT